MGRALVCADNFFDLGQYSEPTWSPSGGNTISAEEEASGNDAELVGRWRRSGIQYWTPTTANSATWIQVLVNPVRAANFIAIDRGHNLFGIGFQLLLGQSVFNETIFDVTMPTTTTQGSVDDPMGVVTNDGAWIKRFPTVAGRGFRLAIDAMGAGLKPQIPGLYLGLAMEMRVPDEPSMDYRPDYQVQQVLTALGQTARSRRQALHSGQLATRLEAPNEIQNASLQFEHLLGDGYPMWAIWDINASHKAKLIMADSPPALTYDGNRWVPRLPFLDFGFHEYNPRIA